MGKGNKGAAGHLSDSFNAVRQLDNGNVYAVMLTEMISNIFKEGMWFKALGPYMLILTNNDPVQVGNMMTLNGVTRAFVGVVTGRIAINSYGVEAVWVVTGFIGFVGILINVVCLCQGSIPAAYFLNFSWAVYNGLWNSCLETTWAKSIPKSKREDVNGARQITNKITTSLGPLFAALIFLACGNTWSIDLVQNVMLFGTMMTVFTVLLCFCFRTSQEIEQDLTLRGVTRIIFFDDDAPGLRKEFRVSNLSINDFVAEDKGVVRLTYPIGHDNDNERWDSRISIVTKDFKDTEFILVKQFHASFSDVDPEERTCMLVFEDQLRCPERVTLHSMQIFLSMDEELSVNRSVSKVHFSLKPQVDGERKKFSVGTALSKVVFGRSLAKRKKDWRDDSLRKALIGDTPSNVEEPARTGRSALDKASGTAIGGSKGSKLDEEESKPNMLGANVIVVCDVLNALGAGFSLKFMDLFLKVDYGVSPAFVFLVAFFQYIFAAWMTPYAKALLANMRKRGYRAKLGVVLLWTLALVFLGLLIVPGMPIWVVVPSIVMMQSLNSCTRAYNRAQLVNYLPREKIANYMTWDALNKANQGGVAIFGAQVVAYGGYRACFFGTFVILAIRTLIYLAFTLRKGTVLHGSAQRKASKGSAEGRTEPLLATEAPEGPGSIMGAAAEAGGVAAVSFALPPEAGSPTPEDSGQDAEDITAEDMEATETIRGGGWDGEESQMFMPSEAYYGLTVTDKNQRDVQTVDIGQVFFSGNDGSRKQSLDRAATP